MSTHMFEQMSVFRVSFATNNAQPPVRFKDVPAATLEDAIATFRKVYTKKGGWLICSVVKTESKVDILS